MKGYIKKEALLEYASHHVDKTVDMNTLARFPVSDVFDKQQLIDIFKEFDRILGMSSRYKAEIGTYYETLILDSELEKLRKKVCGVNSMYRTEHEEEAFQYALDTELICNSKYCPWFKKQCSTFANCEGTYCEEAWENYTDELEDDPYEEISKERKGT